jgi:hypothetical protein
LSILPGIEGYDTYRVYDLRSGKVEIVRNVRFEESEFPGEGEEPDKSDNGSDVSTEDSGSRGMPDPVNSNSDDDSESYGEDGDDSESYGENGDNSESYGENGDDSESYGENADDEDSQGDISTEIRRPKRQRRPQKRYTAGANLALKAASQSSDMPSAMEALKSEGADKWMEAIHSELASLREMRTWELIDKKEVPADARILPCNLVLKVKRHEDGTVERYKARVVILGNLQQVGVDYDLTFAPVIDFTIVRLMLAVASKKGYAVHHMDVKSAFLTVKWTRT